MATLIGDSLVRLGRDEVLDQTKQLIDGVNDTFVFICAVLVFVMQAGYSMLTAGSVRTKNVKNMLMMNICNIMVGTMAFYLLGYGFTYNEGTSGNSSFIGTGHFALSGSENHLLFCYELLMCTFACTIMSGCVAERMTFYAYLGYAFFITSFVWPVAAHWIWDPSGWLSAVHNESNPDQFRLFGQGCIDFGGSIVINVVGGFAGLCGSLIVGPRVGRYDEEGNVIPIPGHSATLVTLGAFLLWFGWYGMNVGSLDGVVYDVSKELPVTLSDGTIAYLNLPEAVDRAFVNTLISPGVSGLFSMVIIHLLDKINDINGTLNGALAGLAAIQGCSGLVEPYIAVVIGVVSAFVYVFSSRLLLSKGLDDPLDGFAIHGLNGIWGAFATGLFSEELYQVHAGYLNNSWGVAYGGNGKLLAANVVGFLTVVAWTCILLAPFFLILKYFKLLRVSEDEELLGMDFHEHGGAAYAEDVVQAHDEEETIKELPANMLKMEQAEAEAEAAGKPTEVATGGES